MKISWATNDNIGDLVPLLSALHMHDVPNAIEPEPETMMSHGRLLTDPNTPHKLLIAWGDEGKALGLAAVGQFFSISDMRSEHSRQIELKELFVMPDARGSRVT